MTTAYSNSISRDLCGGRLHHFLEQWSKLADLDSWLLVLVRDGFEIPFASCPRTPTFLPHHQVDQPTSRFGHPRGFFQLLFTQKYGKRRLILNPKCLFTWNWKWFIRSGTYFNLGWAASFDLKDSYRSSFFTGHL